MAENISTASLAYLGDAVFELMIREKLIRGNIPFKLLNQLAAKYVSAPAQSAIYHRIFPILTEDEKLIIKRGRNLHQNSRSKSANVSEYRHATGLEVLFGHLYLYEKHERLKEIFLLCIEDVRENG